ncbi:hypothetical protein EDD85DRAFT_861193 [Armillaria nabsnona]|nr:hypothetical protein EDD85DRAFT_861193 [Armillaria nabsnona]
MTFAEQLVKTYKRREVLSDLRRNIKGLSNIQRIFRQSPHPRLSTSYYQPIQSRCVSQLPLSSLWPSRSPLFPLPFRLVTVPTAVWTTTTRMTTKTLERRTMTTRTTARTTTTRTMVVATALGRRCSSTTMISRGGTRESTLPTTTRKSTRSPSRSSARASARRMTSATLARLTRMMRRMTSSSASCSSRSSTSTPGRMTVIMARMTKTTRMARRMMTRSTTTLLPGTPTTDTKSDDFSYAYAF